MRGEPESGTRIRVSPGQGSDEALETPQIQLSVVAPFLNEEECLPAFCQELRSHLDAMSVTYEVILVDDGSTDNSLEVLRMMLWPQCRVLCLASNSGHQNALGAGLKASRGEWVITMDSDLQHPPALIPEMLDDAKQNGSQIVTAVRSDRKDDPYLKKLSARVFYSLASTFSRVDIVRDGADFRLMSRQSVDIVNSIPGEKFLRLLIPSLGLRQTQIGFEVSPRIAGSTKYSISRMLRLALMSSVSFSPFLLRVVSVVGLLASGLAFMWLLAVLTIFLTGNTVSGWASVMSAVLIFGGLSLFALGLVGEYLAKIFELILRTPPYVIRCEFDLGGPGRLDARSPKRH